MRDQLNTFGGGLGTGAALTAIVALTCLWKPGIVARWLSGESPLARARRQLQRATDRARLAPNYVDACRAAGL